MQAFVNAALAALIAFHAVPSAHAEPSCALLLTQPEIHARAANAVRAEIKKNAAGDAVRLRFATWNLNLLDRDIRWLGLPHWRMTVPSYREMSLSLERELERRLSEAGNPDVLLLQEVWTARDHAVIERVAHQMGYRLVDSDLERRVAHGLQILIRGDASLSIESGYAKFPSARRGPMFESFGRVERGLLWAKFALPDGQTLLTGTVHLTPFTNYHAIRKAQIDGLSSRLADLAIGVDHVVLGGDLNIAADFASQSHKHKTRYTNARYLYPYFAEETRMRDAFRAVHDPAIEPGYTFNPEFLKRRWYNARSPFTRLDYLWSGETGENRLHHVVDARVVPMDRAEGFASDHYLVWADFDFFSVRDASMESAAH